MINDEVIIFHDKFLHYWTTKHHSWDLVPLSCVLCFPYLSLSLVYPRRKQLQLLAISFYWQFSLQITALRFIMCLVLHQEESIGQNANRDFQLKNMHLECWFTIIMILLTSVLVRGGAACDPVGSSEPTRFLVLFMMYIVLCINLVEFWEIDTSIISSMEKTYILGSI